MHVSRKKNSCYQEQAKQQTGVSLCCVIEDQDMTSSLSCI